MNIININFIWVIYYSEIKTKEDMRPSRQILKDYGNMSSPSVLFVLKSILSGQLHNQDAVTCFSFGAGFLASMLQAEWQL